MEEAYLDDGPAVNFEKATLEIARDVDSESHQSFSDTTDSATRQVAEHVDGASGPDFTTRSVCSVPFRHIDVHTFFTDRNEVVDRAINDCTENVIKDNNDEVVGSWLLTEISLWDTEKERVVLLSKKALYSVKYDFISLKILSYNQIPLSELDTMIAGELIYPSASLAPRLSGLAEGVSSIIQCAVRQEWSSIAGCSSLAQFEPRKRLMSGIRLMWNKGRPLPLIKKWNPFAKDIPWLTYSSHPLFWYKGTEAMKIRFDVEAFQSTLKRLLPQRCNCINASIIIENYCGIGALVHNRNALGFFKIRGKVSF